MSSTEVNEYIQLTDDIKNKNKNTKKRCRCVCCLSFIFLVVFFALLYPRKPNVYLKKLDTISNETIEVFGEFKFKNNNIYNAKWKNLDMNLYWIPYSDDVLGPMCYPKNNICDYYYDDLCSIKISNFNLKSEFTTGPFTKTIKKIKATSTQQELSCLFWLMTNYHDKRFMLMKGNVHSESDFKNFGKIHLKKSVYYLYLN